MNKEKNSRGEGVKGVTLEARNPRILESFRHKDSGGPGVEDSSERL